MKPDEQTVAGEGDEEEPHHDRLMARRILTLNLWRQ